MKKTKRGVLLEVKPSGNNYYLYQVTSVWDKEENFKVHKEGEP